MKRVKHMINLQNRQVLWTFVMEYNENTCLLQVLIAYSKYSA